MMSSGGGPLEFDNIQEIVDIELMFEVICMFFLSFYLHSKWSEKRNQQQTGESSKLLLYYYTI